MPCDPASIMPAPDWLDDAVIGPLVKPLSPGMVGCLAAANAGTLSHLRGDRPGAPTDRLEVRTAGLDAADPLDAAIYGGPLFLHFGHLVAESIHRLWAAHLPGLERLPILFQSAADDDPWRHPWVEPVLALCGVPRARIRLVGRPVRVRRLAVPRQGRVLGGAVMVPGYPALFPLAPLPPAPPDAARDLYVSRAGSLHDGGYLGESLVETVLAEAGFAVLRPEAMPVAELVSRLAAADRIVFAEGSAIHNLELCGPLAARVFVIGRRRGVKRRFAALLDSLTGAWGSFAAGPAEISLDWDDARNAPREARGCSVPDIGRLIAALSAFTGAELRQPDAATVRRARREDLLRFLMHPATGRASDDRQLGHALRRLRHSPMLADLFPPE